MINIKKINAGLRAVALAVLSGSAVFLICPQSTRSYAAEEQKPVDPLDTYVLAIGSCPPWQKIKTACGNDVELFTATLVSTIGVPEGNIKKLLGEDATYKGVVSGFEWLGGKSSGDSAVIVYYNGHGMLVPDVNGDGKKEEVFLLWSKDYPFAGLYAVMAGIWMPDTEFARLLARTPGRVKLVVADTCHAEGADEYMDGRGGKVDYELGNEALLAAAETGEYALATGDYGLFTLQLTTAMKTSGDMAEAFEKARTGTVKESVKLCADMKEGEATYKCSEQGPTIDDPDNVVPLFRFKHKGND